LLRPLFAVLENDAMRPHARFASKSVVAAMRPKIASFAGGYRLVAGQRESRGQLGRYGD
jgi:hypothetical protein